MVATVAASTPIAAAMSSLEASEVAPFAAVAQAVEVSMVEGAAPTAVAEAVIANPA